MKNLSKITYSICFVLSISISTNAQITPTNCSVEENLSFDSGLNTQVPGREVSYVEGATPSLIYQIGGTNGHSLIRYDFTSPTANPVLSAAAGWPMVASQFGDLKTYGSSRFIISMSGGSSVRFSNIDSPNIQDVEQPSAAIGVVGPQMTLSNIAVDEPNNRFWVTAHLADQNPSVSSLIVVFEFSVDLANNANLITLARHIILPSPIAGHGLNTAAKNHLPLITYDPTADRLVVGYIGRHTSEPYSVTNPFVGMVLDVIDPSGANLVLVENEELTPTFGAVSSVTWRCLERSDITNTIYLTGSGFSGNLRRYNLIGNALIQGEDITSAGDRWCLAFFPDCNSSNEIIAIGGNNVTRGVGVATGVQFALSDGTYPTNFINNTASIEGTITDMLSYTAISGTQAHRSIFASVSSGTLRPVARFCMGSAVLPRPEFSYIKDHQPDNDNNPLNDTYTLSLFDAPLPGPNVVYYVDGLPVNATVLTGGLTIGSNTMNLIQLAHPFLTYGGASHEVSVVIDEPCGQACFREILPALPANCMPPGVDSPLVEEEEMAEVEKLDVIPSKSLNETQSFQVYPNPSNGNFIIRADMEMDKPVELTVMDLMGRTLLKQQIPAFNNNGEELDMNAYSKGTYLLMLKQGNVYLNQTIIKE